MVEDLHVCGSEQAQAIYKSRSLEKTFPQLIDYLPKGKKILDVGCGPGTITLDVASIVSPGTVTGIDLEKTSIEKARALSKERCMTNANFEVQDSCNLLFDDYIFDTTYSNGLFDWVPDPVLALREQRRVTKAGGWVCAMMSNHGTTQMYPCYPSLWQFFQSFQYLADPTNPTTYHDRFVGRKSVELFKRAGFDKFNIRGMKPRVWKAGQSINDLPSMNVIGRVLNNDDEFMKRFRERLIQVSAVDEWVLEEARREWDMWTSHPYALYVQVNLFVAAKVEK